MRLQRRPHLLADMRAGIGKRRQRPRMLQDAEHIRRRLVDQRLDEHPVVVLQDEIDDHLDRVLLLLRGEIGDARVVPFDIEHRKQIGVIRLPRIGRRRAAAL